MAETEGGIELPAGMKKNIGPLPIWAWGVILGCLVVAYLWFGHSRNRDNSDAVDDSDSAPETKDIGEAIEGSFRIGGAWNGNADNNGDANDDSVDTNTAWGLRAVAALVAEGVSPIAAQQAITRYLAGESITAAQSALVDRAVRSIGGPPTLPDVPDIPDASTLKISSWQRMNSGQVVAIMSDGSKVNKSLREYIDAGMPKFKVNGYENQTYKVKSNSETAATIAKKYGTSAENIQVLNRWATIPNLKKGQRIKVPSVKGSGGS